MFVNIASLLIIVVCIAGIAVVSVLYGTYNTHDIPNDVSIVLPFFLICITILILKHSKQYFN